MVSPLQSLVAGSRAQPLPSIGNMIRQQALTDAQLKTQSLQQQQLEQGMAQQQQAGQARDALSSAQYLNRLGKKLLSVDEAQWPQILSSELPQISQNIPGFRPDMLRGLTRDQVASVVAQTDPLVSSPDDLTAGQKERRDLMSDLEGAIDKNGKLKPVKDLTAKQLAAARALNIIARPVGSAAQTIAEEGTVESVADVKATITKSVKLAEQEAKARGEALTDLNRAQAALPGLKEVVSSLKELALVATSTKMGKLYDTAAKELGFGSTSGADARSKFIAVVDNQVLPLLKQTFGAAFTVQEAESLKATLGDPDASPSQKIEQLNAFIESKYREIQTKQREVGEAPNVSSEIEQLRQELGL